jgi:hypothetical protein
MEILQWQRKGFPMMLERQRNLKMNCEFCKFSA